jgi:hypothetical protein
MRPIGCRAYVYNRDLRAADKLESRTHIGHLVGTNIFRIWLPTKDTVFVTLDLVFDPMLSFDEMDGYASTPVIEELSYSNIQRWYRTTISASKSC